jgi:chromate transporter
VNAAVVEILLATLYDLLWTSTIETPAEFGVALAAFGLLVLWKTPPWLVVLFSMLGGLLII